MPLSFPAFPAIRDGYDSATLVKLLKNQEIIADGGIPRSSDFISII
jgi:hypothetical protein